MKNIFNSFKKMSRLLVMFLIAAPLNLSAQNKRETASHGAEVFTQEQLDKLLAPIALYPDSLLAQILMASTYPVEVAEADQWIR